MAVKRLYNYNARVTRVVDGDTFDATIDLGFDVNLNVRIRMAGINTPEMKSRLVAERQKAAKAKDFLTDKLTGKDILLDSSGQDKYGRWIGVVHLGKENVNDTMIAEDLAVKYMEEKM
jgi:micrococcal nuclease